MFALDLFNNDYERRLAEGAVDQLEQRRIDDLAMKMDDLVARAKQVKDPEHKAALVKEFQKVKAERDSYFKIKDECMGYGSLGEENINEGAMKEWLWKEAERLDLDAFVANAGEYGMSPEEAVEWWNSINGDLDETGIPGNIPADKIPGKEDLLKGKGRSYYEGQDSDQEFVPAVGDEILWRPTNAKMQPTPVTVLATAPGKLKVKLLSPGMIRNGSKEIFIIDLANNTSEIFPNSITGQKKNNQVAEDFEDLPDEVMDFKIWKNLDTKEKIRHLRKANLIPQQYLKLGDASALDRWLKGGPFSSLPYSLGRDLENGTLSLNKIYRNALQDYQERTHSSSVSSQDREHELNIGAEGRAELKRQANELAEIQREKLRNERVEDEENAFRRAETVAQRKDEMEKIRQAYQHELSVINTEHRNNLEIARTGNNHEIDKLKMEYAEADKDRAERQRESDQDRAERAAEREARRRKPQQAQPEPPPEPEPEPNKTPGQPFRPQAPAGPALTKPGPGKKPNRYNNDDAVDVDFKDVPDDKADFPRLTKEAVTGQKESSEQVDEEKASWDHDLRNNPWHVTDVDFVTETDFEVALQGPDNQQLNFIIRPIDFIEQQTQRFQIDSMDVRDLQSGKTMHWNSGSNIGHWILIFDAIDEYFWQSKPLQQQLRNIIDHYLEGGEQGKSPDLMPGLADRPSNGTSIPADRFIKAHNDMKKVTGQDLDEKKLGQLRPTLGSARDMGKSVKKFRAQRGLDESQQLHRGDPVVVTAPNKFEGATGEIYDFAPSGKFVIVNLYNHGKHSMHLSDVEYNQYADDQAEEDDWYDDQEDTMEGWQDFNKVEPYAVCLAGKPVKKFDYYEQARRFHDNWKQKLYREGNKEKADKITLMPLNLDEEEQKPAGWGEFPPKQEITIVPFKKLKSGETYQDQNKYWQSQGQAPIYKTNEAGSPAQQAAIAIAKKKEQGVEEAISKNDLLAKLEKDLNSDEFKNTPVDPNKSFTRGDHWQGAGPDDYGYTGYQGHGMPKDKPKKKTKEAYTPSPAKPFRNPRGFNKQGTGVGDRLAQLNRAELANIQPSTGTPVPAKDFAQGVLKDLKKVNVKEVKADPTGSWVVYNGSKVKRFKSHGGAKAYAEKNGGKVASSEFYADKIQKQGVAEGQQPMNRNAVIQKLEAIYTKLYKDEDPESYDLPSAVDYWHSLPADQLAMEFEDAIDRLKQSRGSIDEAQTDYQKRRARERDIDAGKPVPKQREPRMTDYQKKRAQQKKELELGESQDTSGVEQAILRRIMVSHTDLLKQFGPQKVMQAAEEVAYNVGDVDEIGTSDVSAYVNQVRQILGA